MPQLNKLRRDQSTGFCGAAAPKDAFNAEISPPNEDISEESRSPESA